MLDFDPRPRHDYPVSAKKALIRVESLKDSNGKHAAFVAVFLCLIFLIRSLWAVVIGGFARWVRYVQSFNLLLPPALVIESANGLFNCNAKETIL